MDEQLGQISESSPTSRRKPRVCPYCKRPFRRYDHLQRHLRLHTNEKPYKCDCGTSFSRQDLLKRHQTIGHALVTLSTPDPSPTGIPESTNDQSQADFSSIGAGETFSQPTDYQITPTEPIGPDGPLGDGQYQGSSLFSSQDLLVLQDLEMFCNNLGPDNEWYLPSDPSIVQIFAGDTPSTALPPPSIAPLNQHRSESEQMLSKLPTEREAVAEFGVLTFPILTVTSQQRERLLEALVQCHSSDACSSLPSCRSLSRFINGFLDGFYPHMPVVHMPTFEIAGCEPEVLLAMCALGAQYRHENRKAVILFRAARDLLLHRAREEEWSPSEITAATPDQQIVPAGHSTLQYRKTMNQARCAFLVIAFAAWQCDENIAREAFNLQSFLARCIRECGLEEPEQPSNTADWHSWIQEETDRRVRLFSFALLNLQFLAFGTPPAILADEINLRLPCSCLEWIAPDEQKWELVRRPGHREQMLFQDALCRVMKHPQDPNSLDTQAVPSPLANYILIHALIQRVLLTYHVIGLYSDANNDLMNGQKDILRNALHAWTTLWQRAPESSLDPRNPNGPVPFTSTALLGVAYIRLSFDLDSYRILQIRNKDDIAKRLLQIPRLLSGPHLLPAALHATHALSIPVKLGVNFVARSHAFVWSVQHSLCGLEFAVFLSKWLFCLAECQTRRSLDEHEARLVGWLSDIVEEGRASGDDDFWPRPSNPSDCAYLGFAVAKLWARLIRGNEQWSLLMVIGDAIDIYADMCERDFMSSQTAT